MARVRYPHPTGRLRDDLTVDEPQLSSRSVTSRIHRRATGPAHFSIRGTFLHPGVPRNGYIVVGPHRSAYPEAPIGPEVVVTSVGRSALEILALVVTLVAGYLYFEELGRLWLFWILAAAVLAIVVSWHGRNRIRGLLRRLL